MKYIAVILIVLTLSLFSKAEDTCEKRYNDCMFSIRQSGEHFLDSTYLKNLTSTYGKITSKVNYNIKITNIENSQFKIELVNNNTNVIEKTFILNEEDLRKQCRKEYEECKKNKSEK